MSVVDLVFADGERFTLPAREDETVLNAARRHGLSLASDCESGDCQTCVATLKGGDILYPGDFESTLTDADRATGMMLSCVASARGDVTLELPYTRASLLPVRTAYLSVTAVERLCDSAVALRGTLMRNAKLEFYAGQYANLTVPDTTHVRAYSMSSPPEEPASLEF